LNGVGISSLCIFNGYILAGTIDNSVWKRSLTEIIGIKMISNVTPEIYYLSQNYPNPFNPQTKIKFAIPSNLKGHTSTVRLIIYDLLGREVATLVNEALKPGTYEADWDASNYSSGVYFYKIITESFVETKKMILMK
ncbi:MAG: T9SS type A sorting domain-containing protein, partial [Ignavibacteria bacterium]|nr:T9SS type A sorting domain-containing protein [Ignavibacteria bacterium]